MNKRKFFRAALGCCLLLPLASCSEDEEIIVPPDPVSYTTLVYMAADNSMDSEVDYTISQLRQGARRSAGTAVVYVDREGETPRLFSITQQGYDGIVYDWGKCPFCNGNLNYSHR